MAESKRDSLQHFVARSRKRLNIILQQLQWTETGVLQRHNGNFSVIKEPETSYPPSFPNSTHSIHLDEATLKRILQTNTEIPSSYLYTAEQKLLIYQYVLDQTPHQRPAFDNYAAFAQLVAVTKREQFKQRRYRKSKPTFNEQLHQLLELQMQALTKQQQQEAAKKPLTNCQRKDQHKNKRRSRSSDKNRQRDRSTERERQRSKYKHKRSRSQSRSRYHTSSYRSSQNKYN